jgi:hypothetical protein
LSLQYAEVRARQAPKEARDGYRTVPDGLASTESTT